MPFPMVHLGVAKKLSDAMEISNKESFYLGVIAPDAVHMRESFKGEDKMLSHLYNTDLEIWRENLNKFIGENLKGKNLDFFMGYSTHILTDIHWEKTVYSRFKARFNKDTTSALNERQAYCNDTDKLDFELFKKLTYRPEIWKYLSNSIAIDVEGIVSAKEIKDWNIRVLHWYDSGESKYRDQIKYISYDELLNFIADTSMKICKDISQETRK